MRYNNAINNAIRRRHVYLKMSAAAQPPCGLGPVQEQLWNARRFILFYFFQFENVKRNLASSL